MFSTIFGSNQSKTHAPHHSRVHQLRRCAGEEQEELDFAWSAVLISPEDRFFDVGKYALSCKQFWIAFEQPIFAI